MTPASSLTKESTSLMSVFLLIYKTSIMVKPLVEEKKITPGLEFIKYFIRETLTKCNHISLQVHAAAKLPCSTQVNRHVGRSTLL